VLVQCEDSLWHTALVLTCSPNAKCEVRLESSRRTREVDLHCILPLRKLDVSNFLFTPGNQTTSQILGVMNIVTAQYE
jgi:hypothetical protein